MLSDTPLLEKLYLPTIMSIEIRVSNPTATTALLTANQLQHIFNTGLHYLNLPTKCSVDIAWLNSEQMIELNLNFRGQNKATNIIAFPSTIESAINQQLQAPQLGDLAICPQVITSEALQQNKLLSSHCTHIALHGLLHLLGYDHQTVKQTTAMEQLEIAILEKLAIANPYN